LFVALLEKIIEYFLQWPTGHFVRLIRRSRYIRVGPCIDENTLVWLVLCYFDTTLDWLVGVTLIQAVQSILHYKIEIIESD